jgi:hypothetical protein
MKPSIFVKDNQLEEWVEAAKRIKEEYGTKKALGYLIGEKFYNVIEMIYASEKTIRFTEEQREKPNYDPIRKGTGKFDSDINLDETYEEEKEKILKIREAVTEFSRLIKSSFSQYEIKEYFDSHPRLGVFGHICTEKDHKFFVAHGMVERSIDTEVKDAMIFGDMVKYLIS